MKRILNKTIILVIGLMLVGGAAFGVDFTTLENSFSDFSDGVAEALPQASTTGLTWSDARVRGFPHFGVGLSFGAVMMPEKAFTDLATELGVELPSAMVTDLGVPFPSYAIDGRVGIPFLPFDVGAKLGLLTPNMSESLGGDTSADYMLAGFDIRYPILKGRLLMPAVSVSAGYNYLSGGLTTTFSSAGDDLTQIDVGGIGDLDANTVVTASDPNLRFDFQTHSLDFKAQASKNLLIFTPYLGGAYTYGWSKAGGGVKSELETNTADTIEDVRDALEAEGFDVEIDDEGFSVLSGANGGSVRAFGGFSVNLLILKLDLNGQYNFTTKSLGGGINARIQL